MRAQKRNWRAAGLKKQLDTVSKKLNDWVSDYYNYQWTDAENIKEYKRSMRSINQSIRAILMTIGVIIVFLFFIVLLILGR